MGRPNCLRVFEVLGGAAHDDVHHPDRFRAQRRDGTLRHRLDHRQSVAAGRPAPRPSPTRTFLERDLRRAQSVHGAVVAQRHPARAAIDEEQPDAGAIARIAAACVRRRQACRQWWRRAPRPWPRRSHGLRPGASAVVLTSNRSNPLCASTQANASLSSPADQRRGRMACFCASRAGHRHQVGAEHHARKVRLRHEPRAEGFHQHHGLHRAAAGAAAGFGQADAQPAELRHLPPAPFAVARFARDQRPAPVERAVFAHKAFRAVLQESLLLAEGEVHRSAPAARPAGSAASASRFTNPAPSWR